MATQVYLIPGFMGFRAFGDLSYFRRVPALLAELLAERGIPDAVIRECPTFPAGSIARRAQRALSYMADSGGDKGDSIHIIGHSTGGLDARLLAAPGVRLIPGTIEEDIGARIRSVITISTPHYGAPLADVLLALPFRRSLEYVGWLGTSKKGRLLALALSRVLQLVARSDDWMGRTNTSLDSMVSKVLKRITLHAKDPVWEFLSEMGQDQGAVIQLTMVSLHLFNAAVADRPGTRYSCVITVAPPPSYRLSRRESLSPVQIASKLAFWTLYGVACRVSRQYPYTAMDIEQMNLNGPASQIPITKSSNDGMVPCQSQAYGRILGVILADHLDVVGQFPYAGGDAHADWLPSGAGFDEARFRHAWSLVAQEIADAEARVGAPAATLGLQPTSARPAQQAGQADSPSYRG
jgi:pimeloyl-ACP methyl ester carboxylesterase